LWTFVIVGSIFLSGAAILYLETIPFLVKSKSVQGTIIELVPKPNDSSERYFLKVVFREETTKRRYEIISSPSFNKTVYNEDEKIKVFYDPKNPENARIGDFIDFFVVPTLLFILGAHFFLCGFLAIRIRRKIMQQKEM
jgi:hypothetical protein